MVTKTSFREIRREMTIFCRKMKSIAEKEVKERKDALNGPPSELYKLFRKPGAKPEPPPVITISQQSRYDLATGHCYVLIQEHFFTGPTKGMVMEFLFDVQTKEDLASTARDGNGASGDVYDEKYEPDTKLTDYENANKYIKRKMSDE